MKRTNDDTKACKDAPTIPRGIPAVGWMTRAGIEDCRQAVITATLDELVQAHDWCRAHPVGNKTRDRIIRGAMRRRFQVVTGSEVGMHKGGNES